MFCIFRITLVCWGLGGVWGEREFIFHLTKMLKSHGFLSGCVGDAGGIELCHNNIYSMTFIYV